MSAGHTSPNKVTGANAGGPHRGPSRTHQAARIAQFFRWAAMKAILVWCVLPLLLTGCFIFGDRVGASRAVSLRFLPAEGGKQPTLAVSSPDVQKALEITDSVLSPAGLNRATPSPAPDANGVIAFYHYTPERPTSCSVLLDSNTLSVVFLEVYARHTSHDVKKMCAELEGKFKSHYDRSRVQVER